MTETYRRTCKIDDINIAAAIAHVYRLWLKVDDLWKGNHADVRKFEATPTRDVKFSEHVERRTTGEDTSSQKLDEVVTGSSAFLHCIKPVNLYIVRGSWCGGHCA